MESARYNLIHKKRGKSSHQRAVVTVSACPSAWTLASFVVTVRLGVGQVAHVDLGVKQPASVILNPRLAQRNLRPNTKTQKQPINTTSQQWQHARAGKGQGDRGGDGDT